MFDTTGNVFKNLCIHKKSISLLSIFKDKNNKINFAQQVYDIVPTLMKTIDFTRSTI